MLAKRGARSEGRGASEGRLKRLEELNRKRSALDVAGCGLLHQLFVFVAGVEVDFASLFEAADDVDDLLLLGFDDRSLDGAEVLHFLA